MLTKEKIIEQINKLNNPNLLTEISDLLEVENQDISTLSLHSIQENLLSISLKQIEDNETLTDEEAKRDVENWFSQQPYEKDSLD